MDNAEELKPSINYSSSFPVLTSKPAAILRHDISDEELDDLSENKKDLVSEMFWAAIGVLFGAAPSGTTNIYKYFSNPNTTTFLPENFVQMALFFCGLTATVVLGFVYWKKSQKSKDLVQNIRSRSKFQN